MRCAACDFDLEAFTGDVCPQCQRFAHPTKLGIYSDLELIKRGGMGSVYRARHPELGTVVAIKTVHTHTGPDTLAERFEQEARLTARIPHPGVVRVYDYDSQEGRLYLVMEHVDGDTLRPAIEARNTSLSWRLRVMAELADILQAAHEQGIVHRDIKPENVMLDGRGCVRVLDFGISRVLDEGERLTQTGEILGTPEYIAPEQILDVPEAVDARTDIYALGVVLYEWLTGRSPFAGANLFQVLKNVEALDPPPPSELAAGIPAELDRFVLDCMAKEQNARPDDCRTVARRLRELAPEEAAPAKSSAPTASVFLLGMTLVLGWFVGRFWPGGESPAAAIEPAAVTTIREVLDAGAPFDRAALAAAARRIDDSAAAEHLFWRGRARRQLGALILARRDLEAARDKGYAAATAPAALLWTYQYRLFVRALGCGNLDAAFELPVAKGQDVLALLADGDVSKVPLPSPEPGLDGFVVGAFAEVMATGKTDAAKLDAWRKRHPRDVPLQLLAAITIRTFDVEAILADVDRMAPMRYLVEMLAALRANDDARFRAALELAQVSGAADFAKAIYVAVQLGRYDQLDTNKRNILVEISNELRGPNADLLRAAVLEKRGG